MTTIKGEMIETGEMEETVKMVEVVEIGEEMNTGYRETKKLLKTSSTSNLCNFKPRMEATLRYLNKPNKKN